MEASHATRGCPHKDGNSPCRSSHGLKTPLQVPGGHLCPTGASLTSGRKRWISASQQPSSDDANQRHCYYRGDQPPSEPFLAQQRSSAPAVASAPLALGNQVQQKKKRQDEQNLRSDRRRVTSRQKAEEARCFGALQRAVLARCSPACSHPQPDCLDPQSLLPGDPGRTRSLRPPFLSFWAFELAGQQTRSGLGRNVSSTSTLSCFQVPF